MTIKYNTLCKGIVWEVIGCVILFLYTWAVTGTLGSASAIGLVYPTFRAVIWYPYDRLFKRLWRRYVRHTEVEVAFVADPDQITISGELVREARGNAGCQNALIGATVDRIRGIHTR
jgi:uncharacterized membrane protein